LLIFQLTNRQTLYTRHFSGNFKGLTKRTVVHTVARAFLLLLLNAISLQMLHLLC